MKNTLHGLKGQLEFAKERKKKKKPCDPEDLTMKTIHNGTWSDKIQHQ